MGRFCYCSKVLSDKSNLIRQHWHEKAVAERASKDKGDFWNHLKMTGFESWLQHTPQGDYMIHCLEGESLHQIFKGLREQIVAGNSIALGMHAFYLNVFGKDYRLSEIEPQIENLLEISLPKSSSSIVKKGFILPLLPHKEIEHRNFRRESMGIKKARHEASMHAFGLSHISSWLQTTPQGKCIVIYSEGNANVVPMTCPEWQEIAANLMEHTGLSLDQLLPDIEWLTQRKF